jgi:DNA-binding CsgD family transcriptional regulator/tetratricopeptide (TPR) repeat protein
VLSGHCYDAQEAGPYFPFFQVLKQLALRDAASRASDFLPSMNLGEPNSSWLGKDTSAARQRFLRELSSVIISVAQRSPMLLIIDDIQWADVGSLLLLNCLTDVRSPNLALLLAERSGDGTSPDLVQLKAAIRGKAHRLELAGLDLEATKGMVSARLGTGKLSTAEVRTIVTATKGNPLFIRELLTHFERRGEPSAELVDDFLAREQLPSDLGAMIDARVGRLSEPVSLCLRGASVFSGAFSCAAVAHVVQWARDAAQDALDKAVKEQILCRVPGVGSNRYVFAHDLFAKRIYEQLSASDRRQYHARVVVGAKHGVVVLNEDSLARHSALGSTDATAIEAAEDCQRAAEEAEQLLAFETAARFWELAMECGRDASDGKRAEFRRRLGWALWASGRWQQAAELWREAVALFEETNDEPHLAEVSLALADVYRWRLELDESKHWAERAAALPLASPGEHALATALIGNVYSLQNRRREAIEYLEEASGYWHEGGCDPAVSWWLSHGLLMVGDLTRAHEIGEQGLAEAQRRGATSTAALLATGLLVSDLGILDDQAAKDHLRIVEDCTAHHHVAGRITLLLSQAYVYGYTGKWREILELTNEWVADFRLAGTYQVATARMIAATAYLAVGDNRSAEELIRRALPDTETMRPLSALYLAEAYVKQGRLIDAHAVVGVESGPILREPRLAASRAMLGHVAADVDAELLWQECYRALRSERRAMIVGYSCTSVQRVLGRLAARLRDWNGAIRHFDIALEQLERGQAWSEFALTLVDYSAMRAQRRRRGDLLKATAMQLRATELLDKLGMKCAADGIPMSDAGSNPFALTTRELEVLELVAKGLRNREIADRLTLSERTVQRHLENVFGKMAVDGRTEAVVKAADVGLLRQVRRSLS